jgi:hypothetical protein
MDYYKNITNNRQIYFTEHPEIPFYKDRIVKEINIDELILEAFLTNKYIKK